MYKNCYLGKFIVIEGLDGSGASTQVELLTEFLNKKGYPAIPTKEPTIETEPGRIIEKVLNKELKIPSSELQELFSKDRKEHLETIVIPSLKKGTLVVSDRYFLSSLAYGSLDLDLEWLIQINESFLLPDITFLLKVSPEICIQRIKKRKKKLTLFEKEETLAKVWRTYELLSKRFQSVYIINGERTKQEVFNEMKEILEYALLSNRQ